MKLSERIRAAGGRFETGGTPLAPADRIDRDVYHAIKSRVHSRLVEQLDLATVTELPREALTATIRTALQEITQTESVPLNRKERLHLVSDLINEILGLGPIEPLVRDPAVQDVLVNGPEQVYVERAGILHKTPVQFRDSDHLMQIVDKIVSAVGRRIDESSPMVDARLPDGSRVNVIVPPLSLNGPVLSIRKFGQTPVGEDDLLRSRAVTPQMLAFLKAAVRCKLNLLISGGTGAGKTTLLNVLSGYVPETERIITIEDSAELRLHQPHVVSLEARPPNIEGRGEVTLTDLVKNSLRMRPDRIIVGEARGAEVMDMLQAMNTGHPGSMSTIHANSPRDAFARMEVMASMTGSFFSERAVRALIASAIHLIVQLARLPDGRRQVVSVSEVLRLSGEAIKTAEVFRFTQQGVDEAGNVCGLLGGSGRVPACAAHLESYGVTLAPEIFDHQLSIGGEP